LPPGLTLNDDGELSGIPTQDGAFTFTVRAQNDIDHYDKEIEVVIRSVPLVIAYNAPHGTVGTAYNFTFNAIGTAPILWSVEAGTLPPGLTLSSDGLLSGTPPTHGNFSFIVRAANEAGNNTRELSILINEEEVITHTITYSVIGTGGTLSVTNGANPATQGSSITLTAVPGNGFRVKEWINNNAVVSESLVNTLTISNIQAAHTITVEFEPIPPVTLTVTWHTNGGLPKPAQISADKGGSIAAPAYMILNGYTFEGWYLDAAFNDAATFPIEGVTADMEFWARWAENQEELPPPIFTPGSMPTPEPPEPELTPPPQNPNVNFNIAGGEATVSGATGTVSISPPRVNFHRSRPRDIAITIIGDDTLRHLRYNNINLERDRDYTVDGNRVIISADFLYGLERGIYTINFVVNGDHNPNLTVRVRG